MAKFKYIGYGFIATNRKIEDVAISSTSSYKALKSAFLNEVVYEAGEINSPRLKLQAIVKEACESNSTIVNGNQIESHYNTVLVVPNIETLGGTIADATTAYCFIIDVMHIVIQKRPDLSTATLNGDVLVAENDIEKRDMLKAEFKYSKVTNKGRKAMTPDARFRKVFWAWQNYYIDTKDAVNLLGCARTRLYSLSKEFMTDIAYSNLYMREFNEYMSDYENKPVRGISLDEELTEYLLMIRDEIGLNWTEKKISTFMFNHMDKAKYLSSDYIRMKLNYMYGKAAMAAATKQYSKGPEYIKQLEEELRNM